MKRLFLIAFIFSALTGFSQSVKDSAFAMHLVILQGSGQLPGADLSARFGPCMSVGVNYHYKTGRNWILGIDPNYFFGKSVKENVLASLESEEGFVINSDGNYAALRLNERGWLLTLDGGKIFPLKFSNPNSGVLCLLGAGYMQHKINIYDVDKKVPQVQGDYKKGYDRLTAGPLLKEFIGYIHFSNNRLVNFYGGFEFYQGFTKSMRAYDFDLMKKDTRSRVDLLFGFRLGWILPIYRREETSYLFN